MSNWVFSRYREMAWTRSALCWETYLRPLSRRFQTLVTTQLVWSYQQLRVNTLMRVSAEDMSCEV